MKKILLFWMLLSAGCIKVHAQNFTAKEQTVRKVFDKIVQAYANGKAAPKLVVLPESGKEKVVACFTSEPRPTIKIDERLIDICLQLKADSLNALAIVISHELAHYYNDHNFCVDYAYAAGSRSPVGRELLKLNSLEIKFNYEIKADDEGIWHAAIAGYSPFGIFDKLIDAIYKRYKLSNSLKGYPSKDNRKEINSKSQEKAAGLFPVFEAGIILRAIGEYEAAAICFDTVISVFPSRENYNNAGVVNLLAVLELQSKESMQFIYPIELDPVSRLYGTVSRGRNSELEKKRTALLKMAKDHFDKAIFIDKNYTVAFINLACYYDIYGNYPSAIGKLDEIPVSDTALQANSINLIKAIAYYHDGNKDKAREFFNKLIINRDDIFSYNLDLFKFNDQPANSTNIEKYKTDWYKQNLHINEVSEAQKEYFDKHKQRIEHCQDIQSEKKINICVSRNKQEMLLSINDQKVFRAVVGQATNNGVELIIKLDEGWLKEQDKQKSSWFLLKL